MIDVSQLGSLVDAHYTESSAKGVSAFGYDAIEPKGKRRPPSGVNSSEDFILPQQKRGLVTSQARDLHRNYAIARFMIDAHLKYNTQFDCYSSSGDEGFDAEFLAWLREVTASSRFDIAGRHNLRRYLRLAECRAVLDGDIGTLQVQSGHVQAIESDVIRQPTKLVGKWVNGVKLGPGDRALAYSIAERIGRGYGTSREVPAQRMFLRAYWDRFSQFRGVSPFTAAHNSLQDTYEGIDYTLARMKVEQLFTMAIYRDTNSGLGPFSEEESGGDLAEQSKRKKYTLDPGRGPNILDLEPGDRAEFLGSNNPSANAREFLMLTIMIALKSLGMPFSFFDGSSTNFFGSRADWLHYERHCDSIREDNAEFLNWWHVWRIQIAVQDKELKLPRKLSLRKPWWEWVPKGMPWWQPEREIGGDVKAIQAGLTHPVRVCRERGRGDFFKNIDMIAKANEYAKSKGVSLDYSPIPIIVEANQEVVN